MREATDRDHPLPAIAEATEAADPPRMGLFQTAPPPPLTRLQAVALRVLLLAAILMRLAGLGEIPFVHYPDDEFHYVWAGLSLLHGEKATSWSWIKNYDRFPGAIQGNIRWHSHDFRIVRPALDHPPLFSLLAGSFSLLTRPKPIQVPSAEGGRVPLWEVDMAKIRLLSIILFIATYALLFALAREAFSAEVALFTLLIYGLTADVVLRNRLVVTENLFVPLLLLNLLWLVRYTAGRVSRRGFMAVTVLTTAAALLTKLAAAAHGGVIVLLLLMAGRRREVLYPIFGLALGLALYLAYGAWQGWEVFWGILHSQADRFSGFNLLLKLLVPPRQISGDPSMLLIIAWLAVLAMALSRRGGALMLAPLVYMLGHLFFASTVNFYEWHYIAYFPFLCLGLGALCADAWRGDDPRSFPVFAALLVPYAFHVLYQSGYGAGTLRPLYLAALGALGAGYFRGGAARRVTVRLTVAGSLGVALYWEVWPCCLRMMF